MSGAAPDWRNLSPDYPKGAAEPTARAAEIVNGAKTSFAAGMRILSAPRRQGIYALYAFCRIVDDIADEDLPQDRRRPLLDAWAAEIDALYAGHPRSVVGRALAGPVARYGLERVEFQHIIEGMRMDAEGPVVAPTAAELDAYIRRVAGAVGILSMHIFGAWRGAVSERFALALAEALQLVNILRDIEADAAMGRLYLPREELERAGIPTDAALAPAAPELPQVCERLGARARACFAEARRGIAAHDRLALAPALMMMGPYEGYLARMESCGWQRSGAPYRLARGRKLLLGLRGLLARPA
ncbi:MAG: phytoene synthase [Alphaproteobacteria bacterium HGW-Alphaproteobacteria-2]|nr:MAG: phytoene synthase [Alphaproteobacteria bacterium HGW-Alphaproteobacteria-2]